MKHESVFEDIEQAEWQLAMAEGIETDMKIVGVTLKPHQEQAIDKLDNGKILCGGVGTGKTITALAYYMSREAPKDIIVITTAKKRDELDWEEEAAKFGIGRKHSVAGKLTVDSWNNIGKYTHVHGAFFVFDEQRLVGTGAWVKAFLHIAKSNRWIMLSATPGDTWLDFAPVFIANGYFRNITDFKRQHVVYSSYSRYPKVERYLSTGKLVRLRHSLLVQMPYVRHTTRHTHIINVDYDEYTSELAAKRRFNPFTNKPMKDAGELARVLRMISNSSLDRLNTIHRLMAKHPRLIVFYSFDYELEILRTLKSSVALAEWNGHKHQTIPETDRWVYLVQYQSGSEGWNCTTTDAMAFYSLTYSYKQWHQAHGRIDRMNTPYNDLHYYVLRSDSAIDHAVWRALKGKKNFNERDFKA
jgi:hypothetical protein